MHRVLFDAGDQLSGWTGLVLNGLRLALSGFFFAVAFRNLAGDPALAADFERWGYADWFRLLTAGMQLVGAGLLLFTPLCFWGGLVLACVLVGAVTTHLLHDPPETALAALVFLVPVVVVMVATRPPLLR